jgi:epsin
MEMLKSGQVSHNSRPSMSTAAATTSPNSNLFGILSPTTTQPTYTNQNQTSLFGGATSPMRPTTMSPTSPPMRTNTIPAMAPTASASAALGAAKPKQNSNFDDLWSMSLGSSTTGSKPTGSGTSATKSIKDLEKEKAQAGIWGSGQQQQQQRPGGGAMGGAGGFGNFSGGSFGGSGAASSSTSAGGADDLLL